jgi:hypothetical protein
MRRLSTTAFAGPLLAVSCFLWGNSDSAVAQSLFPQQNSGGNTAGGGGSGSLGSTGTDFGSSPGNTAAGQIGPGGITQQQTGGFTGRDDTSGQFVGSQNAGQQRVQNFGNFGNLGQGFNGGQPTNKTPKRSIRPVHRVAFKYTSRQTTAVRTSININLGRIRTRRPEFSGVQFELAEGGSVILSGNVADSGTKKLAAMLVRMEPGVRKIENKLTVVSESAAD